MMRPCKDLRCHGESPATPGATTYSDYASDVDDFIKSQDLEKLTLMGHSMSVSLHSLLQYLSQIDPTTRLRRGGKVAMALALVHQPSYLSNLISVDMAPAKGPVSKEFASYCDAMKKVDEARVHKRSEGAEILKETEPVHCFPLIRLRTLTRPCREQDVGIQQFLLTNLKPAHPPTDPQTYRIRLPLDVLSEQLSSGDIGDFPYGPGEAEWKGKTLFIKGAKVRLDLPLSPGRSPSQEGHVLSHPCLDRASISIGRASNQQIRSFQTIESKPSTPDTGVRPPLPLLRLSPQTVH